MLRDGPVPTDKCEEIGNNLHGLGFGAFSTILLLNPKLQAFVDVAPFWFTLLLVSKN